MNIPSSEIYLVAVPTPYKNKECERSYVFAAVECEELKVDVNEVIKLGNRHPRVNVLNPGPGVGGHCIPIGPCFLVGNTKAGEFIRLARKVNDERPIIVTEKVLERLKESGGSKVGILGIAYKPNVDDCRETPAEPMLNHLESEGYVVKCHVPYVPKWNCEKEEDIDKIMQWANMSIITEHNRYRKYQKQMH